MKRWIERVKESWEKQHAQAVLIMLS